MPTTNPFSLPVGMEPSLAGLLREWAALRRKDNPVPFADDFDIETLGLPTSLVSVVDVFEKPLRFRFALVGKKITERFGGELESCFVDEVSLKGPLRFFLSQLCATAESAEPTYFSDKAEQTGFDRLMLPYWGNGQVLLIVAAFAWLRVP